MIILYNYIDDTRSKSIENLGNISMIFADKKNRPVQ